LNLGLAIVGGQCYGDWKLILIENNGKITFAEVDKNNFSL
jgi:hypothetical protein